MELSILEEQSGLLHKGFQHSGMVLSNLDRLSKVTIEIIFIKLLYPVFWVLTINMIVSRVTRWGMCNDSILTGIENRHVIVHIFFFNML